MDDAYRLGAELAESQFDLGGGESMGYSSPYHEVQIHGGVPVGDIKDMYIEGTYNGPYKQYYQHGSPEDQEQNVADYMTEALSWLGISEEALAAMGPEAVALLKDFIAFAGSNIEHRQALVDMPGFDAFIAELIRLAGGDFKIHFGS